ncbi:alpha/beta hydrolase [Amycolatopsis suaedae]|uniref:alpha/beta hydrolase n=1 Tax=Amycolatopsis suaedae TaxID=2510978 RepID=UPI00269DE32F
MPRFERYRLAGVLAVISLLAACTSAPPAQPGPVTETNGPAGPVPGGLERFYGQPLTWGDCVPFATSDSTRSAFGAPGLQCTRLSVPLDYARPDGPSITLGVLRQKASGDRIGSLVVNPGGPGASGMASAASQAETVASGELGQRFDLVGFDPRGVGASQPAVRCLTDAERDADRSDDSESDGSPQGVTRQETESKQLGEKCVQRTEHGAAMLANIGTRDVVRDLDVLRSALGDEKLTYLGYSYGTRIGYSYAEAFPGNVRALVLDGALDPEQDSIDSLVAQGAGFGKAFGEFTRWCVAQQDCALGTDPDAAIGAFQQLVRPLIDNPAQAGERRLSFEDATTGAVQALYSQQLWDVLNTGLNELKRQQGNTLLKLADAYNERGADGSYSTTQDAFLAVRCVDDPRVTDRAAVAEAHRRYAEVAPFLDDGRSGGAALDACAFWPVPNTSQPHTPKVGGLPPVLVVSTTGDPATPYAAGVNLAKALGGKLVTFEGTQHTVFLQGNRCVDKAGTDYLVDGTLPAENTRCSGSK